MGQIGRILMIVGAALFVFGLVVALVGRIGPFGRLPGDFYIERGNFALYLPLGTSLLLSLLLSLVGYLFFRR
ncbi:MAG: DUF2905 domain-containing protein [Thermaerobacter sp.]|nr:DUF2905 domain-containing protein [Thermaerobacter sp.]